MSELIDYPSPSSMLLGGGYDFIKRQIKLWEESGVTMMVIGARSVEQIQDLAKLV